MPRILPGQTDLYALTDARLSLGRPLRDVVHALLNAGIKILQYREKHMAMGKMLEECRMLRAMTLEAGACLIIDDHVDIALLCKADGVHIGQDDLPLADVRSLCGSEMIIGVSTHSPEQAVRAMNQGADYIGVGPIYATKTKEDVVAPVGLSYLRWVAQNIHLPFVAIGGIKEHNVAEVCANGAHCAALVSEFVGARDIQGKVRAVRSVMQKALAAST